MADSDIPAGTITNVRVTVDETVTVNGTADNAGTTYYTKTNYTVDDTASSPAQDQTVDNPDGDIVTTQAVNIAVVPGEKITLRITFNISNSDNAVRLYDIAPGKTAVLPQAVTATIQQVN